jgi:hypothetical protein
MCVSCLLWIPNVIAANPKQPTTYLQLSQASDRLLIIHASLLNQREQRRVRNGPNALRSRALYHDQQVSQNKVCLLAYLDRIPTSLPGRKPTIQGLRLIAALTEQRCGSFTA